MYVSSDVTFSKTEKYKLYMTLKCGVVNTSLLVS